MKKVIEIDVDAEVKAEIAKLEKENGALKCKLERRDRKIAELKDEREEYKDQYSAKAVEKIEGLAEQLVDALRDNLTSRY